MERFRQPARAALATLFALALVGASNAGTASAGPQGIGSDLASWGAHWSLVEPASVTAPSAPRSVSLTASNGSLTVTWLAPLSTGGSAITSYKATASPGGLFCTSTTLTCTIRGLTTQSRYSVTVTATNRIGTSPASSPSVALRPIVAPDAPTAVAGTAGDGFVDLTWTAPGSNGGDTIDSYTATASPGGLQCATTGSTGCRIEGLTNGTAYTFTVVAHNAAGSGPTSAASSPITPASQPAKPAVPTARPVDHGLAVTWTAPANGGSAITNYTVTVQPGGKTCTTATLTCTVTDLENGTAYTATVVATNAVGDGPASDPTSQVTPFGKPSQVSKPTATPRPGGATVTWSPPAENGSPITKYTVTSSPSSKTCTTAATSCTVSGLTNGKTYTFTVKATNAAGDNTPSPASDSVVPQTSPGAPGTPTATTSDRTATITWTAPKPISGAASITGYSVTSSPSGFSCQTSGALTCQIEGLNAGTSYTFKVQALSSVGPGPASKSSRAVVPVSAPTSPQSPSVRADEGSLAVTWAAPASSGGSTITTYTATASPGGLSCTSSTLSCVIRGLDVLTEYSVTVTATNRIGTSQPSSATAAVRPVGVPGPPTSVTGTPGDGFVDLSWIAPTKTGGAAIDSYTATASPGGQQCTTTGATSCRVEGLTSGTSYTFKVVAHNETGNGPGSAASSPLTPVGKPAKPTVPTVRPVDHALVVTWTAPASGGSPITNYTATAQPGGKTCSSSTLTCTISGLENGTAYTVTVSATNAVGDSPPSEPTAEFKPFGKPAQITKPTALPKPGAATVSWDVPADNGSPITKYTVTSSPNSKTCTTTTTACTVTGLTNGKTYTFTVKATNAAGDSAPSEASDAVQPQLSPGTPGTPTVTASSHGATVAWTAPRAVVDSAAITGYRVTSNPGGLTCETSGALTCQFNTLTNGTSYTFTVQALSAVGPGPASKPSLSVVPRSVPDPPVGVSATPGLKRATVTWETPADNGGAPVTAYTVTTHPSGISRTVRSTSAVITGLEVGKSYTFTVTASNSVGEGSPSEATAELEIVPVEPAPFGSGFWVGVDEPNATDSGADQTAWAGLINQASPRVFREQFIWYRIAPTKPAKPTDPADPAYVWTKMDSFARLSARVGAEALVNFYGAPTWAEGTNRPSSAAKGSWKPDPAALRDFGVAMATRYSGNFADPLNPGSKLPRIRMFEAWNEPNYGYFLQPQYTTVGSKKTLTVPDLYRTMLNGFYDGVKSVQPNSIVMTSGLGPYGRSSAGVEIQPQAFAKSLLCVEGFSLLLHDLPCPVKAKFDAFAIHPYTLQGKPTDKAKDANGGGLGNTPDFKRELDAGVRFDNVEPAGPKNLFATEFVWLTNPPGRVTLTGPKIGIAPALAGQYTSETIYRLYKWGVAGAVWYGLRDRVNFWPGGLFFAGDTVAASAGKPGLTAFVTPLFVSFSGTGARYWAMSHCLGPNATVMFQGKVGRTWQTQIGVTPGEDGVATDSAAKPKGITQFRAIASDGTGCSSTSVEMTAGTG